jgi:hypothetical protein
MPSNKDPKSTVLAGAGKLPAGVVPASALLFPAGGGGGAALQAHIHNPLDAHMAGAIGIPATYPATGAPLLSSAGGPIDGESVLDALDQIKDLLPQRPNVLGVAGPGVPNSAIPSWGAANTQRTGGWKNGGNVVFSHYILDASASSFVLSGITYPGDRGVLALYKNTDGNFYNAGATTLVAALWLGSSPAPAGLASANFVQANRTVAQANYTASGTGLDQISLTNRLPVLRDYTVYGGVYAVYDTNFYAYQLARFSIAAQALAAGDAGSFILVHWRESFAVTLAAIGPANLTIGNLVAANCYSAVPAGGNFDTGNVANVNRHRIFTDANSAAVPTGNAISTAAVGTPTKIKLSGMDFYSNGATPLHFNVSAAANGLFQNSFLTDTAPDNVTVPTGFGSASVPMIVDFGDFGGGLLNVPYESLRKQGVPGNYSATNPPALTDIGEYINANLAILSPSAASPVGGAGRFRVQLRTPFSSAVSYVDSTRYLFNSYPQTGVSTTTDEPFVDEHYRYISAAAPASPALPIVPAGGNVFDSVTPFAGAGADLQVLGNQLVYPQVDFSTYVPAGPNYATVQAGDAANQPRRYVRAFNTGIARNTGSLTLSGLLVSAVTTSAAYDGTETTGHLTGGAIIQIKVPGATGWLDLGRSKGDPDLGTQDFKGCSTGVTGTTITYDTTAFTSDNGSGQFVIFVRISFLNNAAGRVLALSNLTWAP